MWTNENRGRYDRSKLRYPSDLTDEEWALSEPLIPAGKRGGNRRTVNVRDVVNGLMYVLSTGCSGERSPRTCRRAQRCTIISICGAGTARSTASMRRFTGAVVRRPPAKRADRRIIDSQSVKSAEKGGPASIRAVTMQARRSRARSGTFLSIRKAS